MMDEKKIKLESLNVQAADSEQGQSAGARILS